MICIYGAVLGVGCGLCYRKLNENNYHHMDYNYSKMSLSPEQQFAVDAFSRGENLFITGAGGTGKTRLIKHILGVGGGGGGGIRLPELPRFGFLSLNTLSDCFVRVEYKK